ncbi:Glutamate 5-kinase [Maudiozyma exigua]|uniref:Glutamate 5-kinase n=1 Tax=Maudiozyma exigua TaxID=34358 RepID=A0A9P6VYT5_MAUEX|nr:Glutamate 5-kinase [Kazachstania exigua]
MGDLKTFTIVIKLGSSSLVDDKTMEPKLSIMSLMVETVVKLRRQGHRVIIVSSGGIAIGLGTLHLEKRPKKLAAVQAIAAVGQGRLIGRWDLLFSQLGQRIAQILLTRTDILNWNQFTNAQNTINELLDMGVVPIVNENDTLSIREIKFGDNDTLSAITAALVGADYLFLLTDVDCLYTDNPRSNPDATPILMVPDLSQGLPGVNTSSGGSDVGTGGMATKLVAADLATNAGVHTIVMKSDIPSNINKVVDDLQRLDLDSDMNKKKYANIDSQVLQKSELERLTEDDVPLHTTFISNDNKHHLKNREFWILHGLVTNGAIIIDRGAYNALTRKNKAGLLPAGIIDVEDSFHELECVEIKVGKRLPNGELDSSVPLETVGRARCNYTSSEISRIKGLQSQDIEEVLGYTEGEYIAQRENLAFPPNQTE